MNLKVQCKRKCRCKNENNRAEKRDNASDLNILLHAEENKVIFSTTAQGKTVGKHHSTALLVLQKQKYRSYKYEKHQDLLEGNEDKNKIK